MDASTPSTKNQPPKSSLSLIIPAYNEQATIDQAIREADEALAALSNDYEILIIDDGSRDLTAEIVTRAASRRPGVVKLLRQPLNLGYGAALARGFRESSKDLVAFTDADCQFDLRELDRLLLLSKDYELVCGYRIDRQDPWIRKLYSTVYNTIVRCLLGTRVRDCDCALKVFHRTAIQNISIETKGFFVNSEVLTKARIQNLSLVEVGVTHRPRAGGESSVSALHTIPVVGSILRFWWNTVLFPRPALATTATKPEWSLSTQWFAFMSLMLLCCAVLFPNLSYPLIEPDESRYVQIAIEMMESGNWTTPTLDAAPYLDKPPLLYWLTATSFSLFGVSETAARIPCVLSALLTVGLVYSLGRRLIGSRAAWCGALSLVLSGGFIFAGRFLLMDSVLTLFTTASLLCGYLATVKGKLNWSWWLVAGVACGLGVLAKGPVALVLCVPPIIAARWLRGERTPSRYVAWAGFGSCVALVALPWFIAVATANSGFVTYFLWTHHLERFTTGFIHDQPWWFYGPIVLAGTFPASLLAIAVLGFVFSRQELLRQCRTKDLGFLVLTAAWVIGFFSLSSCKLATYILPALPMLALAAGCMLDQSVLRVDLANQVTRFLRPFPRRAGAIVAGLLAITATVESGLTAELHWMSLAAIAFSLLAAMTLLAFWKRPSAESRIGWGFAVVVGIAGVMFVFADLLPTISKYRSVQTNAALALQRDTDVPVVYFDRQSYAATMHIPKDKLFKFSAEQTDELVRFLNQHPNAVVVTSRDSKVILDNLVASHSEMIPQGGMNHVHKLRPRTEAVTNVAEAPAATIGMKR